METMLVMGIDPGTAIMGFGLVESQGNRLQAVHYGVITTDTGLPPSLRLLHLAEGLRQLFAAYHPVLVGVEELFFSKNVRTALGVGQARGIALLAAAEAGIPVTEFTPPQVKQAVTGYGKATKDQVALMVQRLLGLAAKPTPDDAADALAIAICAAHVHERDAKLKLWGEDKG